MKSLVTIVCIIVACVQTAAPEAPAQQGIWGVGVFGDLYLPLFNFRDMYDSGTKFGASIHYNFDKHKMVEVEYHHARFNDGSLESATFRFSDGIDYVSPQAQADMTFNSATVNWLFSLSEDGFGKSAAPYLTFGTGLRNYSSEVSGLIFEGQIPSGAGAAPDATILLEPVSDTRTSFSASFGGGVLVPLGQKAAFDVRVRYNLVMGELRPFLIWGVEKTFPFNLIDVGVGLKFNLQ